MAGTGQLFDPRAILAALERSYVDYVIIGGLARVLRGNDEITRGVDICPALTVNNDERLAQAGLELDSRPASRRQPALADLAQGAADVINLKTTAGELKLVPVPAGVPGGFADLRRAATREHLGHGLQPLVASTADLARMAAALHRDQDLERLRDLRRIMELEVQREPATASPFTSPSEVTRSPREWARLRGRDRERERGMER
jgi:hypothetical protein